MFRLKNNPVLTPYQVQILNIFFASRLGKRFFLTGGTALSAFYLGHRCSNDLDLFTLKSFDSLELEKLIGKIAKETSSTVRTKVKTSDYYEVYLENKKESWIQRLDFVQEQPIIFGKRKTIDSIVVDSLENIASNKILTIYGRLEPKDYLDLFFILRETDLDFGKLFEKTKKKDTGLHEFYFANMLAETDNLKHFPKTLKPFNKNKLIEFYLGLSEKMLKQIKPKSGFGLIGVLLILGALVITVGGVVVWNKNLLPTLPHMPTNPKYLSDESYCEKDSDCTTRPNCCNSCYKDYVNIYNKDPISKEQCQFGCIADCPSPETFSDSVCRENKCTPSSSSTRQLKRPEKAIKSSKIPYDLLNLYDEYVAFQKENTGREFKPTYSLIRIYGDKVLVDAVASGDVNVLQDDLQKLGMTNTGVSGRMVSGRLPVLSIDDLSGLDSLQFIRASYMTTQ